MSAGAGLRPATLLKKRLWHRCFLMNFAKFLGTSFLQNTSGRLLLPTPTNVRWIRNTVDTSLQSQFLNHRYSISNEYRWWNECPTEYAVQLKVIGFSWRPEFYWWLLWLLWVAFIVSSFSKLTPNLFFHNFFTHFRRF